MDTIHTGHLDALHILLLDAHVGASDGDGDATVQGTEARDDLCTCNSLQLQVNLLKTTTAV